MTATEAIHFSHHRNKPEQKILLIIHYFFNVFHGTPYSTQKKLFPYTHKRERKTGKEAERVKETSYFNNIKDYLQEHLTNFMFKYNSNNNYYDIL